MGKRSAFERRAGDAYPTPIEGAVHRSAGCCSTRTGRTPANPETLSNTAPASSRSGVCAGFPVRLMKWGINACSWSRLQGGLVAVLPLIPHLRGVRNFAEPCAGDGALVHSNPSAYAAPMPATSRPGRTHLPATASVEFRSSRKATSISLLVVIGVREDGQKVLLAVKNMGGETTEAWRAVLDDLIARGLRRPQFLIVDGAPGLEKALAAIWDGVPTQRCTVHKHRNLLAHAPERLHEEISADYTDMIYAATAAEIEERRRAFLRKWRLRHRAVADSLEEAGGNLFAFARLPPSQWKSARTTNAIERLHEEFKRRIKTQTILPSADSAAMLFWALLASGQIHMRRVDGWQSIATPCTDQPVALAA